MNNDDGSEANGLFDNLTAKLKRRRKSIKMVDKSNLGWENVAKYEAAPIASDSDDLKKISQSEKEVITKRKSKKSNELTLRVPIQTPSAQQFRIDSEYNGFTPPSQRNFNLRFPSNNFNEDGYFRHPQ